eukprot:5666-Heterococcus_DN1.PRE.3
MQSSTFAASSCFRGADSCCKQKATAHDNTHIALTHYACCAVEAVEHLIVYAQRSQSNMLHYVACAFRVSYLRSRVGYVVHKT